MRMGHLRADPDTDHDGRRRAQRGPVKVIGISFSGGATENAQITPTTTCPRPLGAKGKCLREQNGPRSPF